MGGNDRSGNDSPGLSLRVELTIRGILDRLDASFEPDDPVRRDLRAQFLKLAPSEANALVRRLDTDTDDVLVTMFRRAIHPRRFVR